MPRGVPVRASSTPIDETSRYGRTPARSAASASSTAAAWSTVCLRSAPLFGPAPAAKTTASAPRTTSATSSTEACSRSSTTGSTPSSSRSARWSGVRTSPTTVSPRADSRRPSRRATCPWAPATTIRMPPVLLPPPRRGASGRLAGAGELGGGVAVGPRRRPARVVLRPEPPDGERRENLAHRRRPAALRERRPQRRGAPDAEQQLVPAGVVDDEDAVAGEPFAQLADHPGGQERQVAGEDGDDLRGHRGQARAQ